VLPVLVFCFFFTASTFLISTWGRQRNFYIIHSDAAAF